MGHDDSRTQYSILITLRAGRKKKRYRSDSTILKRFGFSKKDTSFQRCFIGTIPTSFLKFYQLMTFFGRFCCLSDNHKYLKPAQNNRYF